MANKVLLKKSSVSAKVPLTTDLDYGELALNYTDEKLYFKNASNTIKSFSVIDTASFATLTGTQTLTNKTISGASNTLSNIANSSLTNSSVTVGTTAIALGASSTTLAGLTSVTSATFVGALTGNATNVTGTVAVANGGTGATTAATARTNLGATTLGSNLFTVTNVAAIAFPRINADNTVSTLDAATFRTAIGAGTSSTTGTVTSVGGTGTVSGLTLTGTVTTTGNLTLGGTLAVTASNFASQIANTVLAAPNGVAGVPTFRTLVAADVPTLNQNTTGNAATATTATNQSGGTVNATTASFSGLVTGASSASTDVNTANDTGSFSVRGSGSTVASMSFHRSGAYAINMGLGTDNVFRIGGWSASNNALQLTGTGNLTLLGTVTAPTFSGALSGNAATATTATNQSGGTVNATTGAFSGNISLPTAAGTNSIKAGTGDGASFTSYNLKINSWWGIGFGDYQDLAAVKAYLDCRTGNFGTAGQVVSTLGTGTSPFSVASTTRVANLNVATAGTADTLTTARTINTVSFNGSANVVVEPFVESDESTNATRYITFVDSSTDGHQRLNEDSNFTINPSTGTVTTNGGFAAPFLLNKATVSESYSIPSGYNAVAAGPVVINNGITVTIPTGSTWVIV